jgi:hypothetical protein
MKYTDFNRVCESPSVVTLRAGGAVRQEKLSLSTSCYWLNASGGFFLFWGEAWRGGETLWITVYMVCVQSQDIGRKSARPFFVKLPFW